MIVVGSWRKLPVGKIVTLDMMDSENKCIKYNVRAFIMRESNKEEYLKDLEEQFGNIVNPSKIDPKGEALYYLVSVD